MIFYIVLPFLSLLLIVIQTMIADIFFFGKIGVELSLILVIYAGFRLDIMKGGILSFILGFFRDCINCSISGPYTFLYAEGINVTSISPNPGLKYEAYS